LVISATLPPDLVVLDYRLPGMSGMEMVTRLRATWNQDHPCHRINDDNIRQQVSEAGVGIFL
jgi:DNA-binding response OmpR family regulator